MWPLTSKEGCDSPHQMKLGLNVNLENSQIIAERHQLVAQGVWSAHNIAILLVFSLFQVLWWLCLLLVRFPPGPGPYASCVCLHFPSPTPSALWVGNQGLCVDKPRMVKMPADSHFRAI